MLGELLTLVKRSGVPETTLARLARAVEPVRSGSQSLPAEERRLALYDGAGELFSLAGRSAPLVIWPDLDVADRASLELIRYLAAMASTPQSKVGGLFVLTFREDEALPGAAGGGASRTSPGAPSRCPGLDLDGIRGFLAPPGHRPEAARRDRGQPGGAGRAAGAARWRRSTSSCAGWSGSSEVQRAALSVLAIAPEALPVEWLAATLGAEAHQSAADPRRPAAGAAGGGEGDRRPALRGASPARARSRPSSPLVPDEQRRVTTLALGRVMAEAGQLLSAAELLLPVAPARRRAAGGARGRFAGRARCAGRRRGALRPRRGAAGLPISRARVLEAWGRVLALLGDYRGAVRRLLEAARRGDGSRRASLALEAARLLIKVGRARSTRALLDVARASPETAAGAEASLAELYVATGRAADALELGRSALAQRPTDDASSLALRQAMGKALLVQGQVAEAQKLFADNAERATAAGRDPAGGAGPPQRGRRGLQARRSRSRHRLLGRHAPGEPAAARPRRGEPGLALRRVG